MIEQIKKEPFALISAAIAALALIPLYAEYLEKEVEPYVSCAYQKPIDKPENLSISNTDNIFLDKNWMTGEHNNKYFVYADLQCVFSNTLQRSLTINQISYSISGESSNDPNLKMIHHDTSSRSSSPDGVNFGELPKSIKSNEANSFSLRLPIAYWHYDESKIDCFDKIVRVVSLNKIINCSSDSDYESSVILRDGLNIESNVNELDYKIVFKLDIEFTSHKKEKYYAQHKYMLK